MNSNINNTVIDFNKIYVIFIYIIFIYIIFILNSENVE